VLALPIYSELSEAQQIEVVDAVCRSQAAVAGRAESAVSSSQ
jgi:hypothetical protein